MLDAAEPRTPQVPESTIVLGGSTSLVPVPTVGWPDTGYVFTTTAGTAIEPDNLRRSWYPLPDAAGLGPVRLHDLEAHVRVAVALRSG